jgi:hypothetical protein
MEKMPAVKKAISEKVISPIEVAFLDMNLQHGRPVCIVGRYKARKAVMPLIIELTEQYGRTYRVDYVGTLQGILAGDELLAKKLEEGDTLIGNLDNPDSKYLCAFLGLMQRKDVRGIAEITTDSTISLIHYLEKVKQVNRYLIAEGLKLSVVAAPHPETKNIYVNEITEIVGLDPKVSEIYTNTLRSPKSEFCFIHSATIEAIKDIKKMSKDDVIEELRKREQFFISTD